jgi:polyhydroxyalkanoate synthesis regulator phasin
MQVYADQCGEASLRLVLDAQAKVARDMLADFNHHLAREVEVQAIRARFDELKRRVVNA